MSGIYLDVQSSLLAFCKQTKEYLSLDAFEIFDFDSNASLNKLPATDLIGIAEYSLENDEETHTGACSFVVCTLADDANLRRLRPVVDYLYSKLEPGFSIPIIRTIDGELIGNAVVMRPVGALPVTTTEVRPLIEIVVRFGLALENPPIPG